MSERAQPRSRSALSSFGTVLTAVTVVLTVSWYITLHVMSVGRQVMGMDRRNNTDLTLGQLDALLGAFERANPAQRQPAKQILAGREWLPDAAHPIDIWNDGDPRNDPKTSPRDPIHAPTDVSQKTGDSGEDPQPARYCHDAMANTQQVIILLKQVTAANEVFGQFAGSQLMKSIPAGLGNCHLEVTTGDGRYNGAATGVLPALPMDAWGNPILFVPSGGLRLRPKDGDGSLGESIIITAPNGRAFWASAGPDGDFWTCGDNLYSFRSPRIR